MLDAHNLPHKPVGLLSLTEQVTVVTIFLWNDAALELALALRVNKIRYNDLDDKMFTCDDAN